MALRAFIKQLSEVDESQSGLYKPLSDGSGFVLDVSESNGYAVENISGLRNTLQTQKRELQSARDKVTGFGDLDPNTVTSQLAKLAELEKLDPVALAKEQVQLALSKQQGQYEDSIGGLNAEILGLNSSISGLLVDSTAAEALAVAQGDSKLLLPHIKSQCKVVKQDDGSHIVQVLDHNGNPRIAIVEGKTRDYTITDLVDEMKTDDSFSVAFKAKAKGGVGGPSDHSHINQGGTRVVQDASHDAISNNLADLASGAAVIAE